MYSTDYWVAQNKKDCLTQRAALISFNLKTNKNSAYRKTDGNKILISVDLEGHQNLGVQFLKCPIGITSYLTLLSERR